MLVGRGGGGRRGSNSEWNEQKKQPLKVLTLWSPLTFLSVGVDVPSRFGLEDETTHHKEPVMRFLARGGRRDGRGGGGTRPIVRNRSIVTLSAVAALAATADYFGMVFFDWCSRIGNAVIAGQSVRILRRRRCCLK